MGITPALKPTRRKVVGGLVVLAVLVVGFFFWQAFTASLALKDARTDAAAVQKHIREGDFDSANTSLAALQKDASKAHSRTGGLLWDLGRHVPYFGRNVEAVQTVSEVLDTATKINAPIALELSKALRTGTFRPADGKINLAEVLRLTPQVNEAARSIDKAGQDLDSIRANSLTFPFNDLVGDLQDQFDQARSAATATSTAFDLLPAMLGKDGPRDYLLMIQNPAELRATGGLPGSLAILHADNGRLSMGWQGSAADINPFTGPVVKLPQDVEQLYGPTVASDFRDLNFTPDFPVAAEIARTMVKQKLHVDVDGVVSVDPIALSYLMAGTGRPIPIQAGVQLAADNVVATLLNRTYINVQNPGLQDAFYEVVAKKIFDTVMSGTGDQPQVIRGLAEGTSQHRVLLWSAKAEEQGRLEGTAISGALPGDAGSSPQVGMYINDSTAGKMDYYLHYLTSVTAVDCRKNGAQDLRASLSLTSTMPKDFSSLGPYVLGTGQYAKQGTIAFNLRIYAPYGGEITGLKVDGVTHSVTADKDGDRQVAFLPVSLKPGQNSVVTADIRTAEHQDADGVFSFTPGMEQKPNGVKIASAC